MSTIAHLSDVHFRHHDPKIVEAVEAFLFERRPDLVVISGDQRARVAQYKQACAFVERLEAGGLQILAVPGNHDVPLYDVARRFLRPLDRYTKFIDAISAPIGRMKSWRCWGSTLLDRSRSRTECILRADPPDPGGLSRGVTGEDGDPRHPPPALRHAARRGRCADKGGEQEHGRTCRRGGCGGGRTAGGSFSQGIFGVGARHVETAGPALVIHAGTAASTRLRGGEQQTFNWLELAKDRVELQVRRW